MWHGLWPERRVDEVPITSVTNGVHQRTWISAELEVLLGDTDPQFELARELPAEDLWVAHRSGKQRLLNFVIETRGARELDPDVLTIGFARRFATYKRASLLFSDPGAPRAAPRRLRPADPGARRRQGASGGRRRART